MSDLKYVLADDGEIYPVPEETAELPAWLNFDAEETEDAIPNIKVSLEKPTQYVVIPEVEEPKVEEWRTKTSCVRKVMTAVCDKFEMVGMLTVFMLFLILIFGALSSNGTLAETMDKVFSYWFFCLIPIIVYLINLVLLCIPKKYLPKGTQVWVVNYREERVEPFTVVKNSSSVRMPGDNFNDNLFVLNNEEHKMANLCGKDIFLTEDAAAEMLAYVQNYNDRMISEYYPEWKNDSNFMRYYKKRKGSKYSKEDAVIAVAGDGKHFVREYINEMQQKQKQRKQDREEKAAMMKEIQQYKD